MGSSLTFLENLVEVFSGVQQKKRAYIDFIFSIRYLNQVVEMAVLVEVKHSSY